MTTAIGIIVGLLAVASTAPAAVCPVLTVRDCCGNVVKTYSCPTPGVTPVGFDMPAGTQFQYWTIVSGSVSLDTLNNPTYLFSSLSANATIQAVCTTPYTLTVEDCDGNVAETYECPEPGVTAVGFTPAAGYEFDNWLIVSGSVGLDTLNNPTYLFSSLSGNATIRANCTQLFQLTLVNGAATTTPMQPGGYYWPDQVVDIVADIPVGAIFTGWTSVPAGAQFGDASQTATTVKMTASMTVTANYQLPVLAIMDCAGNQVKTIEDPLVGSTLYAFNPPEGSLFAGWEITTGNASLDNENSLQVVLDAALADDASIQAQCQALPKLTVVNGSALTPPVLTGGYYNIDELVSITADQLPDGAIFTGWTSKPTGAEFDNASQADTTVKVSNSMTVTANYHLPTLTILDCSGNLLTTIEYPDAGTTLYTFTPPDGYTFNGWQVTAGSVSISTAKAAVVLSKTLTDDATIQALCAARPVGPTMWRLTVVNGSALTSPDEVGGWYLDGTDVQITTTVLSGKVFVGWSADIAAPQFGDPTQISTTITMTADTTVTAIFRDATTPPANQRSGSGCTDTPGIYDAIPTDATGRILGGLLITYAAPDQCFDWTMTDDGMGASDAPGPDTGTFSGFDGSLAYGRTFSISATNDATGYKALVSIRLSSAELAAHTVSVDQLMLCELDTTQSPAPGVWVAAAANNRGPSSPTDAIDDCGFMVMSDGSAAFWAVLDHVGTFAVGKLSTSSGGQSSAGTDTAQTIPEDTSETTVPACGNCGLGTGSAALFCSLSWALANLFSARRRYRHL